MEKKNTENRKRRPSGNLPLRIAVILLCIVGVSVWLSSSILAKYATGSKVKDKARAGAFEIEAAEVTSPVPVDTPELVLNGVTGDTTSVTYKFQIVSHSETAVRCQIGTPVLPDAIKDMFTATVDKTTVDIDPNDTTPVILTVTLAKAENSFEGDAFTALNELLKDADGYHYEGDAMPFTVPVTCTQIN